MKFTMLVGLPGSGKSTYAGDMEGDFTYLSTDALVEAKAMDLGVTYDDLWYEYIKEATRIVQEDFREAVRAKRDIVWDQTNLSRKKRVGVLSNLPRKYARVCVVVTCPEPVRQQRLLRRPGKTIPFDVDQHMLHAFVMPTMDEGWHVIKLVGPGIPV